MSDNQTSDTPTPVVAIDVTQIETPALAAAREEQRVKGLAAMDDYRKNRDPRAYDAVKAHYGNMDAIAEEMQRRTEVDGMEARFKAAFTQPMTPASMLGAGIGDLQAALDDGNPAGAFLKSAGYREAFERTHGFTNIEQPQREKFVMEFKDSKGYLRGSYRNGGQKALVTHATGSGGPFVVPFYDMAYEPAAIASNDILDLIDRVTINSDTVKWIKQTARASSATAVAEATNSTGTTGTKPEATMTFATQTGTVEVLAETAAVTETELADASQMAAIINNDLRDDLLRHLNSQILTGNGSTPNITGILTAAIQAAAYSTSVPVASANVLDNFLHMQVLIATANEPDADAYIIETVDWETLKALKASTSGEYLWGPPSQAGSPSLWGLRVIRTNNITNGTALCGAFRRAVRLYEREGIRFVTGWINDDMYRNIVRVRAELRACLTVRRPNAIVQLTAIP